MQILRQIVSSAARSNANALSELQRYPKTMCVREMILVKEVRKFLDTCKEACKVVLIYGSNHDFSKYFPGAHFTKLDTKDVPSRSFCNRDEPFF